MNKIKNLLKGSPLAMVVASLVIVGVASAAIVSYISNAPTSTVAVSSPVVMGIYEGAYNGSYTGLPSITIASTGGSSMPFTTRIENKANNKIGGYYVMVIKATDSDDSMTGEEFTGMTFQRTTGNGTVSTGLYHGQDVSDILCVVLGDGTLTPLATWASTGQISKKLVIFPDYDGFSTQEYTPEGGTLRKESTGICSTLTPYIGNETRSFSHLDAGEIESLTITPTWNTGALGNFTISAQYVNDLAKYAAEQY